MIDYDSQSYVGCETKKRFQLYAKVCCLLLFIPREPWTFNLHIYLLLSLSMAEWNHFQLFIYQRLKHLALADDINDDFIDN